jgi:hypothetical protein
MEGQRTHTITLTSDELYELEALVTKKMSEIMTANLHWTEKLLSARGDNVGGMAANSVLMEMHTAHDSFMDKLKPVLQKIEDSRREVTQ